MAHQTASPLVIGLGEILWDLLPGGKQLGGAPANFAYHAHVLGADARIISRVGNDALGREILERLAALGLAADQVAVDPEAPTGTVTVALAADGQPRFTIHENVAWDRLSSTPVAMELAARADAICFGSLAQRTPSARQAIQQLAVATPATALRIFDINLRQQYYSRELIESSLRLANVLKLNDTELPEVARILKLPGEFREQIIHLASLYDLRVVALTRGARGSLLYSRDQWSEHPGLPVQVVDSVGAGDAFTAAMVMGFLKGLPLNEINERANRVAAFVCTQPGATPALPPQRVSRRSNHRIWSCPARARQWRQF